MLGKPSPDCGSDGTCTYTFTHAVPAKAAGTYAIGAEARMNYTLMPGQCPWLDALKQQQQKIG